MNEPKLRFSGFYDEWKTSVLKENSTKINDGTHGNSDYRENGNVAFIICNNIKNGKINISKNTPYVTEEQKSNDDKSLNSTSILISTVGTIGNLALYKGENIKLGRSVAYINLNTKLLDKLFCLSYLSRNNIKNYFLKRLTGTSVKNLTLTTLKNTPIISPSLEEQQKIGSFFEKLDQLIQLQSDKLEHFKATKKGYLQKIFPKKNKNIPLIRFKNFKSNWKKYKLSNYLSEPKKEKANVKSLKDIMTLKLHLKGLVQSSNRETLSLNSTKYYVRHSGQLIYGKQNFFNGSIAIIPDKFEGLATSQDVPSLNISKINSIYLFNYISKKDFFKYAGRFTNGTGSKRLHERDLFNLEIKVPNIDEQNNISNFLDLLDKQITIQQQKLDNLKQQKKAYLQKMFV